MSDYYRLGGFVHRADRACISDECQPVLVIGVDDTDLIERLVVTYHGRLDNYDRSDFTSDMQTAIRALLDPKPAEPTGLGAVVRDREGHLWIRAREVANHWTRDDGWYGSGRMGPWFKYAEIDVVEVLSEGVVAS